MRLRIRHTTHFVYDLPAYQSHNQIRMRPLESTGQSCIEFTLEITPPGKLVEFQDYYGNHVAAVSIHEPHEALTIVARSQVERVNEPERPSSSTSFEQFLRDDRRRIVSQYDFLSASPYVLFNERMRKFFWLVRPHADEDVAGYVQRVVAFVRDQFYYRPGVTSVSSTVDEILTNRAGVCQDFAHLTIAVLRLAGVPARYISGYLAPPAYSADEAPAGPQASHAWLEAQLPDEGWIGFDPTHGCRADGRHIRVAVGRDYSDVAPLRGVYRSSGRLQTMSVDLRLEAEGTGNLVGLDVSQHQEQPFTFRVLGGQ
jgi:transglutaminase-like putative cysteine protease